MNSTFAPAPEGRGPEPRKQKERKPPAFSLHASSMRDGNIAADAEAEKRGYRRRVRRRLKGIRAENGDRRREDPPAEPDRRRPGILHGGFPKKRVRSPRNRSGRILERCRPGATQLFNRQRGQSHQGAALPPPAGRHLVLSASFENQDHS